MFYFFILLIIVCVLIFVIKNQKNTVPQSNYSYKQKTLMTDNEYEFLNRLISAFPNHHIFPQVSMGAILDVSKAENKNIQAGRNTFNKKIIDFIIYSKDQKIVAVIELDDKTHDKDKDDKRDAMLSQAKYNLYRFDSRKKPTVKELKNLIKL